MRFPYQGASEYNMNSVKNFTKLNFILHLVSTIYSKLLIYTFFGDHIKKRYNKKCYIKNVSNNGMN